MTVALVAVVVVALVVIAAQARAVRAGRRGQHRRADIGSDTGTGARLDAVTAERDTAAAELEATSARLAEANGKLEAATTQLDAATTRAATAWVRADDLSARVRELEVALGGSEEPGVAVVDTLWALDALERSRQERQAAAVSTALPAPVAPAGDLTAVLAEEVDRLREDAGTPGSLHVDLPAAPSPADALLVLRAVQSLLAVLARHCEAYDLYLHRFETRLLATLVCEAFDGPDAVADETAELLGAISPIGGRLELDQDDGKLRARLSLPLGLPVAGASLPSDV